MPSASSRRKCDARPAPPRRGSGCELRGLIAAHASAEEHYVRAATVAQTHDTSVLRAENALAKIRCLPDLDPIRQEPGRPRARHSRSQGTLGPRCRRLHRYGPRARPYPWASPLKGPRSRRRQPGTWTLRVMHRKTGMARTTWWDPQSSGRREAQIENAG